MLFRMYFLLPNSYEGTVDSWFNEPPYTKSSVWRTIFSSPAKITVKCMEQNLDLTKYMTTFFNYYKCTETITFKIAYFFLR